MKGKGISPLIAAVLLIAFTMAVAGLAGPFLTEITQKAQGDTGEKVTDVSDASDARIEIMSADFDSTTGDYTVTIQNAGTETLENFTVTLSGDNPVQKQVDKKLEEGEIHTFTIQTTHSTKANKITTESRNLPIKTEIESESIEESTNPKISWGTAKDWDNTISETRVVHEKVEKTSRSNNESIRLGKSYTSGRGSLVSFYPLDETSEDTSYDHVGDKDGTIKNSDGSQVKGSQGIIGTESYQFDGSNDYVDIPSMTSPLGGGAPYSYTAWVKTGSDSEVIVGATDDAYTREGSMIVMGTGNIGHYDDGGGTGSSLGVNDDKWYFVAVVDDGSDVHVYRNGSKDTLSGESDGWGDPADWMIGNRGASGRFFSGNIDSVRIYDTALSKSEIHDIYWTAVNGTITTGWKSFSGEINPTSLDISTSYDLNSDGSINVTVESDTDGDGNSEETSDIIEFDGSSSYSVSGLSTSNDKFRLDMNLSTSSFTRTPTLSEVSLEG